MDGGADGRWNTMRDGHVLDDNADGWRWGDVMDVGRCHPLTLWMVLDTEFEAEGCDER